MNEHNSSECVDDIAPNFDESPPIIDAESINEQAARAPNAIKAPELPEPVVEMMDVAYEVLDTLTTPGDLT